MVQLKPMPKASVLMASESNTDPPELSITIPAHNEARRILPYLRKITDYLGNHGRLHEILVVDDGSTDATAALIQQFARSAPAIRLIRLPTCRGKGAAVRAGMQEASGHMQLFTDADGATPIEELSRLEQALAKGADIAIGSRALATQLPQFSVRVRRSRSLLGTFFNVVAQQWGLAGIADTQCGFKLFRKAVAQELFRYASIDGFGFDLEVLYLARQRGYRITEVPVNWSDKPGSKVSVIKDGLAMLRDLAVVRLNARRGLYDPPARTTGYGEKLHQTVEPGL